MNLFSIIVIRGGVGRGIGILSKIREAMTETRLGNFEVLTKY